MNLSLHESRRWIDFTILNMNGVSFEASDRANLSVSLQHLSIDHHRAIHTLVENGLDGPAFALLRLQFESYVRGIWFRCCATEKAISKFRSTSKVKAIDDLISDIEKVESFKNGALGKTKAKIWTTLCDFSHGGIKQLSYRNADGGVQSRYKTEDVKAILFDSLSISFLSTLEIAVVANDSNLSKNLVINFQKIDTKIFK